MKSPYSRSVATAIGADDIGGSLETTRCSSGS
jgi:hypothetical protein